MIAMIFAAGLGKRLRPLTDTTPKPLIKVAGKALIDYHLEALAKAGIIEVVINVSYLAQQIIDHVGSGKRFGLRVQFSKEETPLETLGGLAKALPMLGDAAFIVVNADVFCDYSVSDLQQAFKQNESLGHLLLVENPEFHPEGDFSLKRGVVGNDRDSRLTFAGVSILQPEMIYQSTQTGQLAPLLRELAAKGALSGTKHSGFWFDVGNAERLQEVCDFADNALAVK